MRNNGMRYHTMAEVEKRGWDAVMKRALAELVLEGPKTTIPFHHAVLAENEFLSGNYTTALADLPQIKNKLKK